MPPAWSPTWRRAASPCRRSLSASTTRRSTPMPDEITPTSRGRVVMLVYNGVQGDSRVQKVARSAADAGWDVILLGRSLDRQPHTWREGKAEVRLIVPSTPLVHRKYEFRRRWLRGPLGYPPTGIAPVRHQQMRAWRTDLRVRRDELVIEERAEGPSVTRKIRQAGLR